MSIIISDLSYHYPNHAVFNHLTISVKESEKLSIIGDNGVGKSTLLKLIAGVLQPVEGTVFVSSIPYHIPQHTGTLHMNVAQAMRVSEKLTAFHAIMKGSILQSDYDILSDDWDIETQCTDALAYWGLPHITTEMPMDALSGGEKTKVFLAGLLVHNPEIILLDEPSNHMDEESRAILYQYIEESKATILVVSHDVTLLNQLDATCELSEHGIKLYGGDYFFYREQKGIEVNALEEDIHSQEKIIRLAQKKRREAKQKQEKRFEKGQKNKSEVPRIFKKTLTNSAENTGARLKNQHDEIVEKSQEKLSELRQKKGLLRDLKMDFNDTTKHSGKLLIDAIQINFAYRSDESLWKEPMNFKLFSNDRIQILGNNGTGKTTLIHLLIGILLPNEGEIKRTVFNLIYLDQNYSQVDNQSTVYQLAESYNFNHLEEHEIRLRLNRYLFPSDTLDKKCNQLSGGEKMRLYLCCLMISNQTPDLIVLDEPTNNLDIRSLEILTQTIKNYSGSLLVISHDRHFVNEIGITSKLVLA